MNSDKNNNVLNDAGGERKIDWSKYAAMAICFAAAGAFLYYFVKFAFSLFLPFILAWIVALIATPAAKKLSVLSKKIKISEKLCVGLITFLIIAVLVFIAAVAIERLIYEGGRLIEAIGDEKSDVGKAMVDIIDRIGNIGKHIPLLNKLKQSEGTHDIGVSIEKMIGSLLTDLLSDLGTRLPALIGGMLGSLPSVILFLTVTVMACFYISFEFDGINTFIASKIPVGIKRRFPGMRRQAAITVLKYIRAYIIILSVTATELFIGFSFLKIEYSLLLAIIIAFIDILPVLGVGTVLIPWGLITLMMKDFRTGTGLLILYGIITILRQFIEPKIIGKSLGLHPLVSLISMYMGFRLFGVFGMITGPLTAMVISSVIRLKNGKTKPMPKRSD